MMTAEEYREALSKMGLTQAGAADLLSVDDRTSRRWAKDGVHQPVIVVLLKLLVRGVVSVQDVEKLKAEEATP